MLVLSRKKGQELVIGDNIRISVSRVSGNRVTLGIEAPEGVSIMRAELAEIVQSFRQDPVDAIASGGHAFDDQCEPCILELEFIEEPVTANVSEARPLSSTPASDSTSNGLRSKRSRK